MLSTPNINVLSVYCRLLYVVEGAPFRPSISLRLYVFLNILLSPSTTNTNRSGDSGLPYRNPFLLIISKPDATLTTIWIFAKVNQLMI